MASVIVSGCSDIAQNDEKSLDQISLEDSQVKKILNSDNITRIEVQNVSNGINSSKLSDWKKVRFISSNTDQELNYSVYKFESEIVARDQIDNYSDAVLRRGTYPTVGAEFNGFEVHDSQETYKIFEDYQRKGRFVFGVSINSSTYKKGQADYLNHNLTSQITELLENDRIYANPETLTLSLNQMPTRENSIETDFKFGGRVHEIRGRGRDEYRSTNLSSKGILEIAESSYTLGMNGNTTENPSIILSSVKLYETEEAANKDQAEFINSLKENSTSYERIKRYGNATKIRFIPDTGFKNVIILGNTKNLNYYVITAGNAEYFPETTESLFLQIYSLIPRDHRTSSNLSPIS